MRWSEFRNEQKMELGKLYVPYLALCMFSAFSMLRVRCLDTDDSLQLCSWLSICLDVSMMLLDSVKLLVVVRKCSSGDYYWYYALAKAMRDVNAFLYYTHTSSHPEAPMVHTDSNLLYYSDLVTLTARPIVIHMNSKVNSTLASGTPLERRESSMISLAQTAYSSKYQSGQQSQERGDGGRSII